MRRAMPTQPRGQPCTIVAVGASDCAARAPDGAILRGVRIVGPRPAVGDSAWLLHDEAGPYVQATGEASGGGAGVTILGGGGAITPGTQLHGLSDTSAHSGTLADAQAPQFAKLDGTREFTGVTIPFRAAGGVRLLFTNATTGAQCSITTDGESFVFDGKIRAPFLEAALIDAVEILVDRLRGFGVEARSLRAVGPAYDNGVIEIQVEDGRANIYTDRGALYSNKAITVASR
jgi:hypothetical protein